MHCVLCCALLLQSCPPLRDPMDYIACRVSLSLEFFRQEYCSQVPCTPPGDLPNHGIEPVAPASPVLQADSSLLSHRAKSQLYFMSGIINIVWDINYTYNFIKCPLNYVNYVSSYHYRLFANIISSPIEPSSSLILITLGCFQNFTIEYDNEYFLIFLIILLEYTASQ